MLQLVTWMKRVLRQNGAVGIAEIEVAELEAEVAELTIVAVSLCSQFACKLETHRHSLRFGLHVAHLGDGLRRKSSRHDGSR